MNLTYAHVSQGQNSTLGFLRNVPSLICVTTPVDPAVLNVEFDSVIDTIELDVLGIVALPKFAVTYMISVRVVVTMGMLDVEFNKDIKVVELEGRYVVVLRNTVSVRVDFNRVVSGELVVLLLALAAGDVADDVGGGPWI